LLINFLILPLTDNIRLFAMKKLLPILLFCIFTVLYSNATDVSGLISTNTTWTKANSPYVVTGNILVAEGVMLTIEPGTEIRFDASKVLQINGTLVARGSSNDSIRFTSNTVQEPGAWGNIYFTDYSTDAVLDNNGGYMSGCALEYCIIEYGGKIEENDYTNMVQAFDALPFIQNCSIKHSRNAGLSIEGNSKFSLNFNTFVDCEYGFSSISYFANFKIDHCTFINNKTALSNGISDNLLIENCIFSYNHLIFSGNRNFIIKNSEFSYNSTDEWLIDTFFGEFEFCNNLVHHNVSACFLRWEMASNAKIKSNIFLDNTALEEGCLIGGGIWEENHFDDTTFIENNIFTNNVNVKPLSISVVYTKVFARNNYFINNIFKGCLINLSNVKYPDILPEHNAIFFSDNVITQNISSSGFLTTIAGAIELDSNNFLNNTSAYILKNTNSPTQQPYLDISNNYWGVNTTEELREVVYDFFDDANLGITVFDNVLLSPPAQSPVLPPAQVKKTDMGNGNVKVSWDSNPDDAIGYNVYWGNYSAYTFDQMADAGNANSYIVNGVSVDDRIAVTAYDSDYIHGKQSHTWRNENMLAGHESPYSFDMEDLLGVNKPESTLAFNFYPNPVNDGLIIEIDKNTSTQYLNIINLQGQILKTALLVEQKTEINLNDLPSGMYLIQLCGKNGCTTEKLIKL
jgi:hypothetical protein